MHCKVLPASCSAMYLPLWLVVPALSLILICSMHVVSGTREPLLTASIVRFVQACTSVLHPFVIISSFQINRHTLRWNDSTTGMRWRNRDAGTHERSCTGIILITLEPIRRGVASMMLQPSQRRGMKPVCELTRSSAPVHIRNFITVARAWEHRSLAAGPHAQTMSHHLSLTACDARKHPH